MKKDSFKIPLILALICALAGGLVAGIHHVTAPRIEENDKKALIAVVEEYLPAAKEGTLSRRKPLLAGAAEEIITVKAKDEILGYAVTVSPQGFGGEIRMTVVLSPENKVLGVGILSASETPGLGDRTLKKEHLSSFIGLGLDEETPFPDGISGATVSSEAVEEGIREALMQIDHLLEAV